MDTKSTFKNGFIFTFKFDSKVFATLERLHLPHNSKQKEKVKCAHSVLIIHHGSKLHSENKS